MCIGNITPCGPFSSVITQKLKYTSRWLIFHNDLSRFKSDGVLPADSCVLSPLAFLLAQLSRCAYTITFRKTYIAQGLRNDHKLL